MLKRLHNVAVAGSLIICVSAAVLWGFSYDGHNSIIRTRYLPVDSTIPADGFTPVGVRSSEVVAVIDGEFILGASHTAARGVRPSSGWHLFMLPSRNLIGDETFLHRLGLDLTNKTTPQGKSIRLQLPMWAIVGASALLPAWWYVGWSRQRTSRMRLCVACDYNLTNLNVNDCPNCGKAVGQPTSISSPSFSTPARM